MNDVLLSANTPPSAPAPLPTPSAPPPADAVLARGALLAGLCRFVPVPFLDDVLLRQADRHMVASLLALHGRDHAVEQVRPLYDAGGGCLTGALLFTLTLPLRLATKLVSKLFRKVFVVLAIRDATLQVGRSLLLGRTVDRCLRDGRLPAPRGPAGPGDPAWAAASRVALAFDEAFRGSDGRLLRQALAGVLRGARGIGRLGVDVARRVVGRGAARDDEPGLGQLPPDERAEVEGLVQGIAGVLARPDVSAHLEEFDARFDRVWRGWEEAAQATTTHPTA